MGKRLRVWIFALLSLAVTAFIFYNPQVIINSDDGLAPLHLYVEEGQTLQLDASASTDADGDALTFLWWQQPEIGKGLLTVVQPEAPTVDVTIPSDASGQTYHLICEVHDASPFRLVAYRRIILTVRRLISE